MDERDEKPPAQADPADEAAPDTARSSVDGLSSVDPTAAVPPPPAGLLAEIAAHDSPVSAELAGSAFAPAGPPGAPANGSGSPEAIPEEETPPEPDDSLDLHAHAFEGADPEASLTVDQVSEDPPEVACSVPSSRLVLTPVGSSPAVIEKRSLPRQAPRKVLLDPSAHDVPLVPPPRKKRPPRTLPARSRALVVGGLGIAVFGGIVSLLVRADPNRGPLFAFASSSASAAPSPFLPAPKPTATGLSGLSPLLGATFLPATPTAPTAAPSASGTPAAVTPPEDDGPKIFRVKDLEGDGIRLVEGKMGSRSLMDALTEEKIPQAEVFRILRSFDDAKRFDKPRKNDAFVVAFDRSAKKVKGFEYKGSPVDIWQSRENDEGRLVGSKLDLHVESRRVAKAVLVKDDLRAAVVEAGFDDDILDALDDALESRIALSRIHRGATLRILAQEERMLGKFTRYTDIEAVEYVSPKGEATRIYHLKNGRNPGYFDAKAKASARGGWRYPVKLPRITSRFNPKRMHPVLHVVRPHNGCDFGAATGTPIFAASKGTVEIAGPHGPSGNLVTINHGGGIVTGYAHMSRFAPGIKAGDKVEVRQLIGFVGTTGRSTGPHLHFSLKRNGQFEDPLSLKMDAERGLAPEDREAFEALKGELNGLLDAIPLPEKPKDLPEDDGKAEDLDDDHHESEGASGGAAAAPAPAGDKPTEGGDKPAAPAAPPSKPTQEGSLDSAVWKPE